MFCTKCGNSLNEGVRFCEKCGNPTELVGENVNINVKPKKEDNEVMLTVKPKFKSIYFMLGPIIICVFLMLFGIIGGIAAEEFLVMVASMFLVSLIVLLISWIILIFTKMQLKNSTYDFYNTKVVYSDSFLDKVEKEVKYKHIRECVLQRTLLDRVFGYGRIVLFTNAESGYFNGIQIAYVENSEEVYKRIKELIGD